MRARRALASLGFVAIAVAWVTVGPVGLDAQTLSRAVTALVPLACAIAVQTRSLAAHVCARAFAWLSLALGVLLAMHPHAHAVVFALAAAVIVVALGRRTYDEAARESGFVPIAYGGWFLGAATAASALATLLLLVGSVSVFVGHPLEGTISLALALGLAASATLILRMRSAGVLASGATAAMAIGCALSYAASGHSPDDVGMIVTLNALTVASALAFVAPVAHSRWAPAALRRGRARLPWSSLAAVSLAALVSFVASR